MSPVCTHPLDTASAPVFCDSDTAQKGIDSAGTGVFPDPRATWIEAVA